MPDLDETLKDMAKSDEIQIPESRLVQVSDAVLDVLNKTLGRIEGYAKFFVETYSRPAEGGNQTVGVRKDSRLGQENVFVTGHYTPEEHTKSVLYTRTLPNQEEVGGPFKVFGGPKIEFRDEGVGINLGNTLVNYSAHEFDWANPFSTNLTLCVAVNPAAFSKYVAEEEIAQVGGKYLDTLKHIKRIEDLMREKVAEVNSHVDSILAKYKGE